MQYAAYSTPSLWEFPFRQFIQDTQDNMHWGIVIILYWKLGQHVSVCGLKFNTKMCLKKTKPVWWAGCFSYRADTEIWFGK